MRDRSFRGLYSVMKRILMSQKKKKREKKMVMMKTRTKRMMKKMEKLTKTIMGMKKRRKKMSRAKSTNSQSPASFLTMVSPSRELGFVIQGYLFFRLFYDS